jgi:hypothetical protein
VTPRALLRLLAVFVVVAAVLGVILRLTYELHPAHQVFVSVWSNGKLLDRREIGSPAEVQPDPRGMSVVETVTGTAPILKLVPLAFTFGVVSGRDGVVADVHGQTVVLTPDDLLVRGAYDHGFNQPGISLSYGLDVPLVLAMISERTHLPVSDITRDATFRRIRVERVPVGTPAQEQPHGDTLTREQVLASALDLAHFLARGQKRDGTFRYMIDAATSRSLPGYDWPRHAGATYFLAQAAAVSGDPTLRTAALRAAGYMRDRAMLDCGEHRCISDDHDANIGSSALGVIAFVEIVRTGLDPSFAAAIPQLTAFLRSQQRPDGEFMHEYNRQEKHPIDVQRLYFAGETALALARAFLVTHDRADLDAAARAVAYLVGPAWSFPGNRYYFGEEHWTCQAMAATWADAPNPKALDFCQRWQKYGRKMQFLRGETPFDAEGAYGVSPLVTPRFTPVGSRTEAAVATLEVELKTPTPPAEVADLEAQIRRSLALLVRQQFRPGPSHLFASPSAVLGGMPGSSVDWQLRIDYAQHAGSAMLRWLDVTAGNAGDTSRTQAPTSAH